MKARCIILSGLAICARAQNNYAVRNLVSDLPGVTRWTGINLKNPQGPPASSASPFWISNNRTGAMTASGGTASSSPTGQVFHDTGGFELAPGKPAQFLFSNEDGTIAARNSAADPGSAPTFDYHCTIHSFVQGKAVVQ